jgi:hypothetical protein
MMMMMLLFILLVVVKLHGRRKEKQKSRVLVKNGKVRGVCFTDYFAYLFVFR